MNKKVVFPIVLSFLLLVSFCACNSTDISTDSDLSNLNDDSSIEEIRYVADVPDVYFGDGRTLTFLVRNSDHTDFETWDLVESEINSDVVNDAIKRRNDYIEEKFGVEIKAYAVGGERNGGIMMQTIRQELRSESGLFDLVYSSLYDATALAAEGAFYDLTELPYIDLTAEWWDNKALENLSLANRTFFAIGDISIQINDTLPVILFNKKMVEDNDFENPYEIVRSNKWTLDKMMEMAKKVYKDDGDAVVGLGDTFGIGGQNDTMYNLFYNTGGRSFQLSSSGIPQLSLLSEQNSSAFMKIYEIMTDEKVFMNAHEYARFPGYVSSPIEYIVDSFTSDKLLFYADGMLHIPEMRGAEVDFGLLPLPKYNEDQEEYSHLLGAWGATVVAIPKSCADEKNTALLIEAIAAESKNTLSKVYYEKVLTYNNLRDTESEDMLKIILESKSIDMGFAYRWGALPEILVEMVTKRDPSFVSMYESRENAAKEAMQRTIESFTSLSHYIAE